jgi:hypothetical protein
MAHLEAQDPKRLSCQSFGLAWGMARKFLRFGLRRGSPSFNMQLDHSSFAQRKPATRSFQFSGWWTRFEARRPAAS